MTTSLSGKIALIAGTGQGTGRAIALEFAKAGTAVALVARSGDQPAETADQVQELRGILLAARADLGDPDQVVGVVRRTNEQLGIADVLVNNAAVDRPLGPSISVDPKEWATALGVDVIDAAILSFAVLQTMVERKWGRIVNVSSAITSHPGGVIGMNAYVGVKAAP